VVKLMPHFGWNVKRNLRRVFRIIHDFFGNKVCFRGSGVRS
jgi:hypothetical protein